MFEYQKQNKANNASCMLTNQFNILKLRFVNVQTGRLKILKRYFEVVVQKTDKYNSRKKKL